MELFLQGLFSASDDSEVGPSLEDVPWEMLERCCALGELGVRSGCPGLTHPGLFSYSHVHWREEVGDGRKALLRQSFSSLSLPSKPCMLLSVLAHCSRKDWACLTVWRGAEVTVSRADAAGYL